MNKFIHIKLLIIVFIIVWICSVKIALASQESNDNFQNNIDEFVVAGLDFKLGETKADIIKNLGNPKSIKITKVPNFHYPDEIVDEIHELFYDGLYIKIYKATEGNREIIQHLSITSDKYKVKQGLNIGSSENKVRTFLGNPLKIEQGKYTYEDRDGYPDHVYFYFRDGKIYKIDWEYWID